MKNKNYDDRYLERFMVFFESIKTRSYALLNPQPANLIVDVGCGTGADALRLATSLATVYGVDHDPELIAIAQQNTQAANLPIEFLCSEANSIPLASGTIDKVRYDRIFQHLPNHEATLSEAYRLLKDGGIIQVIDADYLSLTFFMEDINLERKIVDMVAYQRFPNSYKVRQLPRVFKESGFELISIEIQSFVINTFSLANYAIHFEDMVQGAFDNGNLTKHEYNTWQQHRNLPDEQFNLNVNLMLMMARKQNDSISTKQVQPIGTYQTD